MSKNNYVVGLDYGTDSVRTVIINASNGEEVASSVFSYPRWNAGRYCDPAKNMFRQHPLDYIEGLEVTVKECVKKIPEEVRVNIKGIAVDTTGSTPVAVNREGTPLSLTPGFEEIQMPCLSCGRITLQLRRQKRSIIVQGHGVELIIQNLKEEFIHQNGSGQKFCMY